MTRSLFYALLLVNCIACGSVSENRKALLIGYQDYDPPINDLSTPHQDVDRLSRHLGSLGFDTQTIKDAGTSDSKSIIAAYMSALEKHNADTLSVIYYAGHAVQLGNDNYLIPNDGKLANTGSDAQSGISLSSLIASIPANDNVRHLIILDSCRTEVIDKSQSLSAEQQRGIELFLQDYEPGLAEVELPGNQNSPQILVAYAAAPGQAAYDSVSGETQENSPYMHFLLKHMNRHTPVENVFKLVRDDVVNLTQDLESGVQTPWYNVSLSYGDLFFYPPPSETLVQPPDIVF